MKLLKYLLCIIFLFVYVIVGIILTLLVATLDFLKSIPHVWHSAIGKKPKKQSILSNEDMVEVLKGTGESLMPKVKTGEVEEISLNPKDLWVSYLDKWGNG